MQTTEGVIKFRQELQKAKPVAQTEIEALNFWREVFYLLGLVGQHPKKYNGAGYGNLSKRLKPYNAPCGKRSFLITGSQTGFEKTLQPCHYTTVLEYEPQKNFVRAKGPIEASSESMTHASIYDRDKNARYVFHVHCPNIWNKSKKLKLPATKKTAAYGTPELAKEVKRLFLEANLKTKKIFSTAGHEDGIFAFGSTPEEAGLTTLKHYFLSL